jgi:hypothetical protein
MKPEESAKSYSPEFEAWARQRMLEMDAEAAAATEALGLPPDRKFDVLRVLYGKRSEWRHMNGDEESAPESGTEN